MARWTWLYGETGTVTRVGDYEVVCGRYGFPLRVGTAEVRYGRFRRLLAIGSADATFNWRGYLLELSADTLTEAEWIAFFLWYKAKFWQMTENWNV